MAVDPAEIVKAITRQGQLIGAHEQHLSSLDAKLDELCTMLKSCLPGSSATVQTPDPATIQPTSSVPPKLPLPDKFGGDTEDCRGFLNVCRLHFRNNPATFSTSSAKVTFVISLLKGKALVWVSPYLERNDPILQDAEKFLASLQIVFDKPGRASAAEYSLLDIQQDTRSVAQYAIEFRTLAAETNWDSRALRAAFRKGLTDRIKDELVYKDLPEDLEKFIELCVRLDVRYHERCQERLRTRKFPRPVYRLAPNFQAPPQPEPETSVEPQTPVEPMDVSRLHLTESEKQRRRSLGLCLYCGLKGHLVSVCPSRPVKGRV